MRGGNISPPAPASLRRHALSEQLAGRQAVNSAKDKEVLEEMRKLGIPENLISEISRQRAWTKFGLVDACLPRYELEISS
jgi:hypothetical protein